MAPDIRPTHRTDTPAPTPRQAPRPAAKAAPVARPAGDASGVAGKARVNDALAGLSVPGLSAAEDLLDAALSQVKKTAQKTRDVVRDVAQVTRRTLTDVVAKVNKGLVTPLIQGTKKLLTPTPQQVAQFQRAYDYVTKGLWSDLTRGVNQYFSLTRIDHRIVVREDAPDVNPPTAEARKSLEALVKQGKAKPEALATLKKLEDACKAAEARGRQELANPQLKAETQKALARLPEADRRQFAQVSDQLKGNPRAQAALHALARSGQLQAKDLQGGRSLLHHLHAIGTQAVHPSVKAEGQTDLLAHVVLEIAHPPAIAQKGRNTCAATVIQNMMATHHPAEYARLVAGLASPDGKVAMKNGDTITRNAQWTSDEDQSYRDGNFRSLSSRLFQPALMHYGGTFKYDNVADGHMIPLVKKAVMGMLPHEASGLLEALTGKPYNADLFIGEPKLERLLTQSTAQRPVMLAVNYAEREGEFGPHWLQIVGYDPKSKEITALNPWGRRETLPLEVAKSHFLSVIYPE